MTVLKIKELSHVYYEVNQKQIGVFDIDLQLKQGEALGLVGESGSGKSTIARLLCRFLPLQTGQIKLDDKDIQQYSLYDFYRKVQYISQQPQAAFHPKRTVMQSLLEVCYNFKLFNGKAEAEQAVLEMLRAVGLTEHHAQQLPPYLSGGECQRAAIARALLVQPEVLVCDEITSALDVTVQYEVMKLLIHLKENSDTAFLFISHDIALVSQFCERMLILKDGSVRESASTKEIVTQAKDDYTKLLLSQYSD